MLHKLLKRREEITGIKETSDDDEDKVIINQMADSRSVKSAGSAGRKKSLAQKWYTERDWGFTPKQLQHRIQNSSRYPIKVQLAVASNRGLIHPQAMKHIRADERALQTQLNKEIKESKVAYASGDKEQIDKENFDLRRMFGKIGMRSYIYNFPNNLSYKASLNKDKRNFKGKDRRLVTNNQLSRLITGEAKKARKLHRAEKALEDFRSGARLTYKRPNPAGGVAETINLTEQMLNDRFRDRSDAYNKLRGRLELEGIPSTLKNVMVLTSDAPVALVPAQAKVAKNQRSKPSFKPKPLAHPLRKSQRIKNK